MARDGEGARVIREVRAGFTAAAGEAAELADTVLAMYSLPEQERNEMGKRGRAYFEEHVERNKLVSVLDGWMREFAPGASQ